MISTFSVWLTQCLRQIFPVNYQMNGSINHQGQDTKKGKFLMKSFLFSFINLENQKYLIFKSGTHCAFCKVDYMSLFWKTSKITNNIKFGIFSSSLTILSFIKNSISLSHLILPCHHLVLRSTPRSCSCPSLHYSSWEWTNISRFSQTCIIYACLWVIRN